MTGRIFAATLLIFFCISCALKNSPATPTDDFGKSTPEKIHTNSAGNVPAPDAAAQSAMSNPAAPQAAEKPSSPQTPPAQAAATPSEPDEKSAVKESKPAELLRKTKTKSEQNSNSEDVSQEQESLDLALELFARSKVFREKGDIDNALKCLDEAYSFILDVNGDPDVSRQKDDLRLMISKRIVEISAARYVITTGQMSEIPMILNEDVQKEIRSFQTVERNFFIRAYQRSASYRPTIVKYLKDAGLPEELSWLPLVESGFNVTALSRARALGLWQFIPSTGYKYSLQRDRWIDERMDLEKSTLAAIAYMKELHAIFGDWLTCLAAYNCGEGRVLRVISKQHINYLDHFWDLYRQLPNETARYVPRFLATLHIIKDPAKYGMDLQALPETKPVAGEVVKTSKCMRIQDIAAVLDLSKEALASLNSELRFQMTPDREYNLKVPEGTAKLMIAAMDKIPVVEAPKQPAREYTRKGVHRVRKGETLNSIARKYRVTSYDLIAYNSLQGKIHVGQRLKIPGKPVASGYGKKAKARKTKGDYATYKVQKGETLASIAQKHNTSAAELKKINGLKKQGVRKDQVIKVPQNKAAQASKSQD